MHIEDVMFVDQFHVVALEYIFYSKGSGTGQEDIDLYYGLEDTEEQIK